jgi:hypothetical protein
MNKDVSPDLSTLVEAYAKAKQISRTLHELYPRDDSPESIPGQLKSEADRRVRLAAQQHRDRGGFTRDLTPVSQDANKKVTEAFRRIRPQYKGR